MCDQDHFEQDRQEYESGGLVTRRQFGVLVGAGIAMMLPKVANAVAVTDGEVNIKTPDGEADCYFVRPSSGSAPAASCSGEPSTLNFSGRATSSAPSAAARRIRRSAISRLRALSSFELS